MRIIFHTQRISAILQQSNNRFYLSNSIRLFTFGFIMDPTTTIFSDVKRSNLATRRKKSILLCNTRGSETSPIFTDSSKFDFTF